MTAVWSKKTGEASGAGIEQFIENSNDHRFWTAYYCTVAVAAMK